MSSLVLLLIGILATWRLTLLTVYEDGPLDIFARLRALVGVTYDEFSQPTASNVVGKALTCHRCASVWMGLAVALLSSQALNAHVLLYGLALSAGAILVHECLLTE